MRRLYYQGERINEIGTTLVVTMMMEAISFSKMPVITTVIRCHIPEHGILPSDRREKPKYHRALTGWSL
jgi:hypothetical protein